jgi:hypothetical protein
LADPWSCDQSIDGGLARSALAHGRPARALAFAEEVLSRTYPFDRVKITYLAGRYTMRIGNHIPPNVPPEAIKRDLDLSAGFARPWCALPPRV